MFNCILKAKTKFTDPVPFWREIIIAQCPLHEFSVCFILSNGSHLGTWSLPKSDVRPAGNGS